MKASELMIGDWVKIKGHLDYDKVREIARDESMQWYISFACSATLFRAYEFEPVTLTPEILEKNGFSPETFLTAEWEKKVYFKEFPGCVVEPDNSGKYIFGTTIYWNKTDSDGSPIDWGTMYNSRIYNLQYVHELQHALRLCGLDELADNFKI